MNCKLGLEALDQARSGAVDKGIRRGLCHGIVCALEVMKEPPSLFTRRTGRGSPSRRAGYLVSSIPRWRLRWSQVACCCAARLSDAAYHVARASAGERSGARISHAAGGGSAGPCVRSTALKIKTPSPKTRQQLTLPSHLISLAAACTCAA